MKKLFTFLTAATFLATAVSAQRTIDLEATMPNISPTLVGIGENFAVSAIIENVGSTPLKTTDTILYSWTIGGVGLDFTGSGQPTIYFRTGISLNQGDTIQLNRNYSFSNYASGTADSTKQFCLVVTAINRGADQATDANTSNNSGCHALTLKAHSGGGGGGTNINDYQLAEVENNLVSFYPNPASDLARLQLTLNSHSPVTVRIMDITGKLVYEKDHGKLSKGDYEFTIPTQNLQNGVYLYRVDMGHQSSTGKLSILK